MSHRLFDRVGLLVLVASAASCGSSMPPVEEPPDDPCATPDQIDGLRLNQIQVVGSHNSYRRRTYEPIFQLLKSLAASLPPEANPDSLDYDHLPLPEQKLEGFAAIDRTVELCGLGTALIEPAGVMHDDWLPGFRFLAGADLDVGDPRPDGV